MFGCQEDVANKQKVGIVSHLKEGMEMAFTDNGTQPALAAEAYLCISLQEPHIALHAHLAAD